MKTSFGRKMTTIALLMAVSFSMTGCATLVGLVTGPFTGAWTLGRETNELAVEYEYETMERVGWTTLYGFTGLFVGIPCGAIKGFHADMGMIEYGHYDGSSLHPPFGEVFDPFHFRYVD